MTLNAEGDPNAVFIFQVSSSMTTGTATTVVLSNGAQACNVFWQVGASVTLGGSSTFAGTVIAQTSITAGTDATLDGRLLAENGAVNLDSNTITTSACASPPGGTATPTSTTSTATTPTTTTPTTSTTTSTAGPGSTSTSASNTAAAKKLAAKKLAAKKLAAKKLAAKKLAAKKLAAKKLAAKRRAQRARLAKLHRLKLESEHHHSPAQTLTGPGGFTG